MLKIALLVLSTSYFSWYFQTYETLAIYPFDARHVSPEQAGEARLSEERITTPDGETLVIWRAPAGPGKPTVVYFSGNAGGLKERANRIALLIDAGFGVIAPAYRGSSGSTGRPSEAKLLSDAALIMGSKTTPLILYGESLGSALAIQLAADGFGSAVVLEAPFTSIIDLVGLQYPTENLANLITQKWESTVHAPRMKQPVLVLHGAADRTIPIAMGRQIFELAGSADKEFVAIENGGHSGLWTAETRAKIFAFLARH